MTTAKILKNHFLIATVIFAGLLFLITIFLIIPAVKEINRINYDVFQERKRLENLYARGQLQKKVKSRYDEVKEKALFLDEIFLKENHELQYVSAMEEAAEKAGVALKINAGGQDIAENKNLSKLLFSFEASGRWPEVLDWLQKVEAMPYYTNYSDATAVAATDSDSASSTASVKINAETYWLKL